MTQEKLNERADAWQKYWTSLIPGQSETSKACCKLFESELYHAFMNGYSDGRVAGFKDGRDAAIDIV